jgi:subtilisin family serine protease
MVAASVEGAIESMPKTRLKLGGATLLALGVTATGVVAVARQSPVDGTSAPAVSGAIALPQDVGPNATPGESAGRPRSEPADPSPESLLEVRLQTRRGELRKAEAQREHALAKLARLRRLNQMGGGFVGPDEMAAAEAEVKVAEAERDIKAAGVREAEIVRAAGGERADSPSGSTRAQGTGPAPELPGSLGVRLREIERKLDLILERLGDPRRGGDDRGERPEPPG